MRIGGIIDISTKDIPNRATMVFFTVGCNFNCSFCHNKKLLEKNAGREYRIVEIISLIKDNILINSISITGGEPTLQKDLVYLCKELKKIDVYVSIDTNGTNPKKLKKLLPHIDRIALDIKSSLTRERLRKVTSSNIDPRIIIESFSLVNQSNHVDFEIRTTFVKNLLKLKDIEKIIEFLNENNFRGTYVVQQYQYSDGVGNEYEDKLRTPTHDLLLNILKPYKFLELPFEIYLRDNIVGYRSLNELLD